MLIWQTYWLVVDEKQFPCQTQFQLSCNRSCVEVVIFPVKIISLLTWKRKSCSINSVPQPLIVVVWRILLEFGSSVKLEQIIKYFSFSEAPTWAWPPPWPAGPPGTSAWWWSDAGSPSVDSKTPEISRQGLTQACYRVFINKFLWCFFHVLHWIIWY